MKAYELYQEHVDATRGAVASAEQNAELETNYQRAAEQLMTGEYCIKMTMVGWCSEKNNTLHDTYLARCVSSTKE